MLEWPRQSGRPADIGPADNGCPVLGCSPAARFGTMTKLPDAPRPWQASRAKFSACADKAISVAGQSYLMIGDNVMNKRISALALLALMVIAPGASAAAPFFNRGATAFDPEVSVVNSGIVQDVQATVSPDRKYVTLGVRAASTKLLALREFSFQNGANPIGQVGIGPANGAGARVGQSVLTREGMARVDRGQR